MCEQSTVTDHNLKPHTFKPDDGGRRRQRDRGANPFASSSSSALLSSLELSNTKVFEP